MGSDIMITLKLSLEEEVLYVPFKGEFIFASSD
jgi:hypothetical protein